MSSLFEIKSELDALSTTGSECVYNILHTKGVNMSKNINGIFFDLASLESHVINDIKEVIENDKNLKIKNEKGSNEKSVKNDRNDRDVSDNIECGNGGKEGSKLYNQIQQKGFSSTLPRHIKEKILNFSNSICSRATVDAVLENSNKYSLCVKKYQKPSQYSDEIHTEILQKEL